MNWLSTRRKTETVSLVVDVYMLLVASLRFGSGGNVTMVPRFHLISRVATTSCTVGAVPRGYKPNPKLSQWVKRMRHEGNRFRENPNSVSMTAHQLKMLEASQCVL